LRSYAYTRKPRNNSTQVGCLNILTIQKYLILLQSEKRFSDFFSKGPIKLKMSFLNYRDWLLDNKLITHKRVHSKTIRGSGSGAGSGRPYIKASSIFLITEKGRKFMEMIK